MPIYKGAAERLDDYDLPRIGDQIGVGEDPLHALLEVETRGTGFDKHGRVIMLFEPHKFHHHLRKNPEKQRQAIEQGLAYPKWRRGYPPESYTRLEAAMKIDETAALKSCSWGLGQVMGENYRMAGYESVSDMVASFAENEDNQLQGMINFVKAAGIDDDLRRLDKKLKAGQRILPGDCIPIVRVYNGPKFAENDYHNRFARSINKWARIKDTPWAKDLNLKQVAAQEEAENFQPEEAEGGAGEGQVETTDHEPQTPEKEEGGPPPAVISEKPAEPKPENPAPQDIVLNPTQPKDETSAKTNKIVAGTVLTSVGGWLVKNFAEAKGFIQDNQATFKWVIFAIAIIAGLWIIRQIVKMVINQVGAIMYNLKSMQYHARQDTNNVSMGATPAKE